MSAGFPEPDDPHPIGDLTVTPPDRWTCTRDQLIDALAHCTAQIPTWVVADVIRLNADSMADAILAQLPESAESAEVTRLKAQIADYENAICWNTSCFACAAVLDSSIREHERAEKAEDEVTRLKAEIADQAARIAMLTKEDK